MDVLHSAHHLLTNIDHRLFWNPLKTGLIYIVLLYQLRELRRSSENTIYHIRLFLQWMVKFFWIKKLFWLNLLVPTQRQTLGSHQATFVFTVCLYLF